MESNSGDTLKDILNKTDEDNNDMDEGCAMDKAMKDIFASCDPEHSGLVLVSKLIEFITPFLQENLDALSELRVVLDPEDKNPVIDSGRFYQAMSQWASKLSSHADETDSFTFHNVTPRDLENLDERDLPFVQSTPRSSFGHHLLKGYVESGILNTSNISSYGCTGNSVACSTDKMFLEDQIYELEHQKRKLTEDLLSIRQDLASALEQNEILQVDMDILSKILAKKQKINEQLLKERKSNDDSEETLNLTQKQIKNLERTLSSYEKSNNLLQQELDDLSAEKQKLESQIAHMSKSQEEYMLTAVALKTELDVKDQEMNILEGLNTELQRKLKELQEVVEQCSSNNDKLRVEKITLEKLLRERVSRNDCYLNLSKPSSPSAESFSEYTYITHHALRNLAANTDTNLTNKNTQTSKTPDDKHVTENIRFTPPIRTDKFDFYNYDSPFARIRRARKDFLSPRLRKMLEKTISPNLDSSKEEKSTVGSDDSPCLISEKMMLSFVPHSTPIVPLFEYSTNEGAVIIKDCLDLVLNNVFSLAINKCEAIPHSSVTGIRRSLPNIKDNGSPSMMYVSDRSNNFPNPAGRLSTPPYPSPGLLDSSEDDLYYKLQILSLSQEQSAPHDSLQTEMEEARVKSINIEQECDQNIKLIEYEHRILSLQCELMQHQNCSFIIDKDRQEIDQLKQEKFEIQEQLRSLTAEVKDLRTQVLLNQDKGLLFHQKYKDLEDTLNDSKTYVTEMKIKLNERNDLEMKYNKLKNQMENLESENSVKYIKIVELTMEIDKLQQEIMRSGIINTKKDNMTSQLLALENDKHNLETIRQDLFKNITSLEQKNNVLQCEMADLLSKLTTGQSEKLKVESEKHVLETENTMLLNLRGTLRFQIENLETEKQNLTLEKENLVSENITLQTIVQRLESEKKSLQENLQEIENRNYGLITEKQKLEEVVISEKEKFENEIQELINENSRIITELHANSSLKEDWEETSELYRNLRKEYESLKDATVKTREESDKMRKENISLLNQNRILDNKNAKLRCKNGTLRGEKEKLADEINKAAAELESYKKKHTDIDNEKRKLVKEVEELRSKLENNEVNLKTQDIERKKISLELVDLKLTYGKMKESLEFQQKLYEKLSKEKEQLGDSVGMKDKVIVNMEGDNQELSTKVDNLNKEISSFNEKCKEYSALNETVKLQLNEKERDCINYNSELGKRDKLINNLSEDINFYKSELTATKELQNELKRKYDASDNEIENLKNKCEYIKQENNQKCEKITELETIKAKHRIEIAQQLENKLALRSKLAFFEKELESAVLESKKIEHAYNNRLNEIEIIRRKVNLLKGENNTLNKTNQDLLHNNNILKSLNAKLNEDLSTITEIKDGVADESNQLYKENEDLLIDNESKRKLIEDANTKLVIAHKQMQDLEERLLNCDSFFKNDNGEALETYMAEKNEKDAQLEKLQAEMSVLRDKAKLSEEDNKDIKQKYEELMLEKERWLTEKVELSKRASKETTKVDSCCNCKILETKLARKGGFDKLVVKNHTPEQKVEELDSQLLKNSELVNKAMQEKNLMQEKRDICNEKLQLHNKFTKTVEDKDQLERNQQILTKEIVELRSRLQEYHDKCVKLINEGMQTSSFGSTTTKDESSIKYSRGGFTDVGRNFHMGQRNIRELLAYMNSVGITLQDQRLRLTGSTSEAFVSWKSTLDRFSEIGYFLEIVDESSLESPTETFDESLNEEMFQLKHQIHVTSTLFKKFTIIKRSLINTDENVRNSLLGFLKMDLPELSGVLPTASESSNIKCATRFTLKPATLIVRPDSPDSPSTDELKEISSVIRGLTNEASRNQSPDSAGDNVPVNSRLEYLKEGSFGFSLDNALATEYFDAENDAITLNFTTDETPIEQEASPNLNNDVLENLGLGGENLSANKLSEKETEEKFTAIVLGFTIDNASLKERYRRQNQKLVGEEMNLAEKIAALLDMTKEYLTEHQYTNISSQMEAILRVCTQISISAVQFGALRHEDQLAKAVSLMVNYVAIIKKRCGSAASQYQSTKPKRVVEKFRSLGLPGPILFVMFWASVAIYFTIFVENYCCSQTKDRLFKYPWNWISWDDTFAPFLKKEYRDGPPPT